MLALERTHRLRADRAWMPGTVRNSARLASGVLVTGAGAAAVGTVLVAPAMLLLWKGLLIGGAGIAIASDRVGKAVMQRQIRRMTRGEINVAELRNRAEGELVVMRGTIEADNLLGGALIDATGVFRRLEFTGHGKWVHEAAVNFSLVDEAGERIFVEAAGARWLTPHREKVTYPGARFTRESVPERVRDLVAGRASIDAIERVLGNGEQVQLVGYKTTRPDASGDVVDYRSPPQRATLRSGSELPLIISRVTDLR